MLVLETLRPSKMRKRISHYPFRSDLCITTAHLWCSWPIFPTVVHGHQHVHFSSPLSSSVSTGWAVRSCRQESGVSTDYIWWLILLAHWLRRVLLYAGVLFLVAALILFSRSNCSCTENTLTAFARHPDDRRRVDVLGMPLVAYLVCKEARGGAVGWGTALQAGRSRIRFPMVSLEFFIDIIRPTALWPWGWLSILQKLVKGTGA
jgi:hypothetical protein